SNERIGPMPLWPSTHACQNASLPTPLGATTPKPLTTTLRMTSPDRPPLVPLPEGGGTSRSHGRSTLLPPRVFRLLAVLLVPPIFTIFLKVNQRGLSLQSPLWPRIRVSPAPYATCVGKLGIIGSDW